MTVKFPLATGAVVASPYALRMPLESEKEREVLFTNLMLRPSRTVRRDAWNLQVRAGVSSGVINYSSVNCFKLVISKILKLDFIQVYTG